MPADVDHRWFVGGKKERLAVIHRPSARRRQHEEWLKAGAECDLDFFRRAPRLTAHRLSRRFAFCTVVPHSRTLRSNRIQRGLERPPGKKEPPLPPFFGMVAGTGRRGGFLPTKTIPFFGAPLPRGGDGEHCNLAGWRPSHVGRCRFTPLGLQIMLKKDSLGQRRR